MKYCSTASSILDSTGSRVSLIDSSFLSSRRGDPAVLPTEVAIRLEISKVKRHRVSGPKKHGLLLGFGSQLFATTPVVEKLRLDDLDELRCPLQDHAPGCAGEDRVATTEIHDRRDVRERLRRLVDQLRSVRRLP